jgi:methylenetetrahydrofolate dehydrogenase (NADP+)/methenyltetrahydrofolate cyclohydrolase
VRVGFESTLVKMPSTDVWNGIKKIKELNENDDIDGFIVQLPLLFKLMSKNINGSWSCKDVDGFHPENFGKMALDMTTFIPALHLNFGIVRALWSWNARKTYSCYWRSHSRRPMSILMGRKGPGNSTVTLTHSYTKNIAANNNSGRHYYYCFRS